MPRRRKQWLRPTEVGLLAKLSLEDGKLILEASSMSMAEIAQMRGWPIGTVKSRLNRARQKLCKIREEANAQPQHH